VLDANGGGSTSTVMAALDWVLANHAAYGIRVVNLSLGHPIYESATTDPLVQMVDQLTQRGIVVAVSAGNSGRNSLGQTVYGSVTSPGNAQGAITVGAADTSLTDRRSDDTIASFSSRGPTRIDRFVKPDVLAPGYQIASLLAPNSTLANKYPGMKIGTSYFRLNGTSMAAPVAAGTAALLLQANPGLSANTIKAILQFTAQRLPGLDVMTQGSGELNVAGAVRFASMVKTDRALGSRWVMSTRKPVAADLLFGETAYWGRALIFGGTMKGGTNSLFMNLAQWSDNIVWGMLFDNIVWSMDDNIVWGMLDNIVWGMLSDNIVWGMNDDQMVWGFDDSVSGLLMDNIVWSMMDNIVWGMGDDTVQALNLDVLGLSTDDILGLSILDDAADGESILIEGEVR